MTGISSRRCPKCGSVLPVQGTGRPRTYCSPGCRRAAEYELRRVAHRLETLEADRHKRELTLIELRSVPEDDEYEDGGESMAATIAGRQLAEVKREIRRSERRLLELLDAGEAEAE